MKEWENYGDKNFLEYGGCLISEADSENCFHVIFLETEIFDYVGKYKKPMIVAKCYVDLSDYLNPTNKTRKQVNTNAGYGKDYIPQTEEEKKFYCVELINYMGFHEFEPNFPEETGCNHYSLGTIGDWIVGKQIVKKFLKGYNVPTEYRT